MKKTGITQESWAYVPLLGGLSEAAAGFGGLRRSKHWPEGGYEDGARREERAEGYHGWHQEDREEPQGVDAGCDKYVTRSDVNECAQKADNGHPE